MKELFFETLDVLYNYGFNINSKGFNYWIQAIELNIRYNCLLKMGFIYKTIAEENNDTKSRVERAMRTAKPKKENSNSFLLKKLSYEVLRENEIYKKGISV